MSFVESTRADIVAWMAGLSCIRVWTIGREKQIAAGLENSRAAF